MKILHICAPQMSDVTTLPWEIQKKSFWAVFFIHTSGYLRYLRRKQTVIHLPTPPENVITVTCEMQNFHLTEGLLRSFKRWRLWKEPVVGCHRWLWKEPVVMCVNWNVRQAVSQQVFGVITFCVNTCFQFSSTLISRKFSPCRNKPLPQAATCLYQYTRSSCSVPQTQY